MEAERSGLLASAVAACCALERRVYFLSDASKLFKVPQNPKQPINTLRFCGSLFSTVLIELGRPHIQVYDHRLEQMSTIPGGC